MSSNQLAADLELAARRRWLQSTAGWLGAAAVASLNGGSSLATENASKERESNALPHFPPRAKRVIYLFQSGAPSQLDLFDYKPQLAKLQGSELPDSIRRGQRLTGMTSRQAS